MMSGVHRKRRTRRCTRAGGDAGLGIKVESARRVNLVVIWLKHGNFKRNNVARRDARYRLVLPPNDRRYHRPTH